MSQSPRDPDDVEPAAPSPDENEPQPPNDQQQQGTENNGTGSNIMDGEGTGYDFEVKEQDRWLPIANGKSLCLFRPCVGPGRWVVFAPFGEPCPT